MNDVTPAGILVEESPRFAPTIALAEVSTALFIGPVLRRPLEIRALLSVVDFEHDYGDSGPLGPHPNHLAVAVKAFFDNGGQRLWVQPLAVAAGATDYAAALAASIAITEVGLVAAPGASTLAEHAAIEDALIAHANVLAGTAAPRFVLLDPPPGLDVGAVIALRRRLPESAHAALFYPWLQSADDGSLQPPSGYVAGAIALSDATRGVQRAPGGVPLHGVAGLGHAITDVEVDALNPVGVDVLRSFVDGQGGHVVRLWGARTVSSDPEWRYLSLRRYVDQVERSILAGLGGVVFEPNAEPLWTRVRAAIEAFLFNEWRNGALAGVKPDEAFLVRCDPSTMTQVDIDQGRLRVLLGLALLRPAEFTHVQLTLATAR